jgi:hypothetical protein
MLTKNTRQREANIRVGTETRMILQELYRAHIHHTNSMIARRLRMGCAWRPSLGRARKARIYIPLALGRPDRAVV